MTVKLSDCHRAGGVDTQKRKPSQKTTFGKKILFSPCSVQRTNHRYKCPMMPTQPMISIFALNVKVMIIVCSVSGNANVLV